MKQLLCLIFVFGITSCSKKPPIEPNKMTVILWDMMCADEWLNEKKMRDTAFVISLQQRTNMYNQVFATHQISKEKFYAALDFYKQNVDLYKQTMDSVVAYGLREREKLIKKQSIIPLEAN